MFWNIYLVVLCEICIESHCVKTLVSNGYSKNLLCCFSDDLWLWSLAIIHLRSIVSIHNLWSFVIFYDHLWSLPIVWGHCSHLWSFVMLSDYFWSFVINCNHSGSIVIIFIVCYSLCWVPNYIVVCKWTNS